MWPSRAAKNIGVNPDSSFACMSAPASRGQHDRGVSFGRGPHQGRLLALFTRVGVGAVGQQRLHRVEISRARRRHENRFAAAQRRVRVGAGVEQERHDVSRCRSCRPGTAEARHSDSRR